MKKPNIVFIFSDQQRYDSISCYGSPIVENLTPNLDRMAADGVLFQNAFTPQPLCGPARACLQTGQYATECGCFRNGIPLPEHTETLAQCMTAAGYTTAYIGKWHLAGVLGQGGYRDRVEEYLDTGVPVRRRGGYNDFWLASDILEYTSSAYGGYMFDTDNMKREFPEDRYRADVLTDWTIEYLNSMEGAEKPFFLFLSYVEPHHQNDAKHFLGPKGSKERFKDYLLPRDLEGEDGNYDEELPDYLGCCESVDRNVGRLRAELEKLNMADDTLIIYTTDHGCHFRTRQTVRGKSMYKRTCHDSSIRIPMIIHGPGFNGGKVIDQQVSLMDLPPTIIEAAMGDIPDTFRGRSLQDLMKGASDWNEDVFVQISEKTVARALRTRKWTYCVDAPDTDAWNDPASDKYQEAFLYSNENDPYQKENLVTDPRFTDIRAELAGKLISRMVDAGENKPTIAPCPGG